MPRPILLIILIFSIAVFYYLFVQATAGTHIKGIFSPLTTAVSKFKEETRERLHPKFSSVKVQPKNNSSVQVQISGPFSPEAKKLNPPLGFRTEDLSPFYSLVRFDFVNPPGSFNGGQFALRGEFDLRKEEVNITGWRVKDNLGHEIVIPQAISDYKPFGVVEKTDIKILPGHVVNLFGWNNAFVEALRLNKCIGYLNNIAAFNPSFPSFCPSLYERSEIFSFSGKCQDFITSLGSCEVPDLGKYYNSVSAEDSRCRSFLDRFNYQGCYLRYANKADFFTNEWRIWLGRALPFDPLHDRLLLFDKNNLLVDEYAY